MANTVAESWKFTHLKRKTDHDAKRFADFGAIGQPPTVTLLAPAVARRD